MDFIANSLIGLAVSRTGLSRMAPRGAVLLLLSFNIPDIDYLALLNSQLAFVELHRGYTHSLIGLPGMALLCVVLTCGLFRQRLPWLRCGLLACIGVGCHLLLDWLTAWGFRPLIPFSSTWYHLDFGGTFDAYLIGVLGLTALWPHFSKLVSGEIGAAKTSGRGSAISGLVALVLLETARGLMHQQAMGQMDSRLFDGASPLRIAAIPNPNNPLKWTGIVETATTFREIPIDMLQTFDSDAGPRFFKLPETLAIQKAKVKEEFRYFLYFARFPVWTVEPVLFAKGQGKRVQLTDLRFGSPATDTLGSLALEDAAGQVLKSWFTLKSSSPPPP